MHHFQSGNKAYELTAFLEGRRSAGPSFETDALSGSPSCLLKILIGISCGAPVECLWLERVDFFWADMFCGTVLSTSDDVVSLEAGRRWTTVLTWENLD
jgi:hypothetical protein